MSDGCGWYGDRDGCCFWYLAAGFVILPFNINISYIGIWTPPSPVSHFKSGQSLIASVLPNGTDHTMPSLNGYLECSIIGGERLFRVFCG